MELTTDDASPQNLFQLTEKSEASDRLHRVSSELSNSSLIVIEKSSPLAANPVKYDRSLLQNTWSSVAVLKSSKFVCLRPGVIG